MAKYGSDVGVDVKGGMSGGLAEGKAGGETKAGGGFGTGAYAIAKNAEKKAVAPKLPVITPTEEPPAPAADTPDEFGDGFDDGAGGDENELMATADFAAAPMAAAAARPTTKKTSPDYIRGNVAGRMFRRQYYQNGRKSSGIV